MPQPEQLVVLPDDQGHPAYAVPLQVLEAHRATPEERATVEAALKEVEGIASPAAAALALVPTEVLSRYRLTQAQQTTLNADQRGDATGAEVEAYTQESSNSMLAPQLSIPQAPPSSDLLSGPIPPWLMPPTLYGSVPIRPAGLNAVFFSPH